MRKWLVVLVICLAAAGALAYGPPSVNPQLPAQNTPLTNIVVQGNFQHTYNDLVTIFNVLNSLGAGAYIAIPVSPQNGGTGLSSICPNGQTFVSNGASYHCATSGGGSGGITSQQIVSSGSTATAICGQIVGFNSASGTAKTLTIPTPIGSLCQVTASDMYGDAGTNNITVNPASGTIFGLSVCYSAHCSLTFIDTTSGWISI